MPIYEYVCRACGQESEQLVRASDTPLCPSCASEDLEKRLSVFAPQSGAARTPALAAEPCGACGHPGGPGACALD
jgi:putative FmdB family regulatory protein